MLPCGDAGGLGLFSSDVANSDDTLVHLFQVSPANQTEREERIGRATVGLMVWTPPDGISVPEWWCHSPLQEASMNQVSTVGLDLAKHIFQLHGADR